ncbi:hypothetical protein TWF481_002367 [Arthrobotrys musiformis]|uniref:RRM domain-containing protein n=1 Tax=Arthrobotrys musiformis TaxID=47236 RepID=A0AAV9VVT7_9PEZI
MAQPRRPRTRAPRVRKRDREFKDLPETDATDQNAQEEDFSIGGKDTTNEGLAKSLKRKRDDATTDDTPDDKKNEEKRNGDKKTEDKKDGEVKQVHNEAYSNLLKTAKNKKRKERRKNAAAKARAEAGEGASETPKDGGDGDVPAKTPNDTKSARKDSRFIVFVGNLPYTTTQTTLLSHLSSVKPTSVRIATYKPGEKPKSRGFKPPQTKDPICKGYAFVEFSDAGMMKNCLSLFHHSDFEGRKINVELTAGGGGKSTDRKERVKAKNESLNTERKKRYEEDKKKKLERGEKVEEEKPEEEIEDGVHPSRRKRVRR